MKRLYILFSDIREHTKWAEKHSADELITLLKKYYSVPRGDFEYIETTSDEILMFFKDISHAIKSAKRLKAFGYKLKEEYGLGLGVSLHVGEVENIRFVKNNIRHIGYAGYAISIGKRLEGLCDTGELVISEDVYNDLPLGEQSYFKTNLKVNVKGKKDKIHIYLSNGELRI